MVHDMRNVVDLTSLSQWLAMQAIVVPVNNWLEPNVGDGKQEVCQAPETLLSACIPSCMSDSVSMQGGCRCAECPLDPYMLLDLTWGWCVQYMKWAGIPASKEDTFWTNPTVRNLIKNDYKVLVTRKNTFNGKLYGEDNTIFAWDIYNVRASATRLLPAHSPVC